MAGWFKYSIFEPPKFVASVSMLKSKTRNMLSPIAIALRCTCCAGKTRICLMIFSSLQTFARLPNTDFIPYLASFCVMSGPEINAFLNQGSYRWESMGGSFLNERGRTASMRRGLTGAGCGVAEIAMVLNVGCWVGCRCALELYRKKIKKNRKVYTGLRPRALRELWVWGGTGCASQGDSSP
eukprot:1146228-Pelagomonas_calceolata.AAC.1